MARSYFWSTPLPAVTDTCLTTCRGGSRGGQCAGSGTGPAGSGAALTRRPSGIRATESRLAIEPLSNTAAFSPKAAAHPALTI